MKKRFLSAFLVLAMMLTLIPAMSFAASAEDLEPVTYVDRTWDGEKIVETEKKCTNYIPVDEDTMIFEDGKWYVVKGDLPSEHRIMVTGTANLILSDDCTFNVYGGIYAPTGNTLNIYGGPKDSGMIYATGPVNAAGIGGSANIYGGNINICGGIVYAVGGDNAAGIGGGYSADGGNVTVLGGTVIATGGYDGAAIGGGYKGYGGNVAVYGGSVYALSGYDGRAIGAGNEGTENGTFTAAEYASVRVGEFSPGTESTLAEYIRTGYKYVSVSAPYVSYIDRAWDGEKVVESRESCTDFIVVDEDTITFEDGKWYVVRDDTANDHRITVSGTANLLLCDGNSLAVYGGIFVPAGNTLNIYGQSNDSGKLTAYGPVHYAAIGGNSYINAGTVNIYGGTVTAEGSSDGAGIGGGSASDAGDVTVYGGVVSAAGGIDSAGIGGGYKGDSKNVAIYGGSVTAIGGNAKAIGAGNEGTKDGTVIIASNMFIRGGENAESMTRHSAVGNEKYVMITPCFEFVSKNLALESALAFRFYGCLYDETPDENARVEFKIGDIRTLNVPLSDAVRDEKGRYIFTCCLNALELDEKIEAVFHDGKSSVERPNPLSVTDYLDKVLENHTDGTDEDEKVVNLVNAISNYAHYAQPALDETHDDYTVGEGGTYHGTEARTDITLHTADELARFAAVKYTADGFTAVKSTSRTLVLDDETAIVLYITPANADYVPNVKVTDKNGSSAAFEFEKQDNGKYKVVIRGIAAHMLADAYMVDIDDGKLTYTNLSALSYAYSILSGNKSEAYKNAVSALYDYYLATVEYMEFKNGGHYFGELIPEVPAACTETGLAAHYQCGSCGRYFDENKVETTLQDLLIKAEGHNYTDNNDGTATCTKCGDTGDIFDRSGNTINGLTDIGKTIPKIVIPEGVTEIASFAFPGSTAMEELVVPDSVTSMYGNGLLDGCTNLKTVSVGSGINSLTYYTFYKLPNLTAVTLDSETLSLANYTFEYCDNLEKIVLGGSALSFDYDSIYGCPNLKTIEYNGTVAEWQACVSGVDTPIDEVASDCVVYCTDGTCTVDGTPID